MISTASIKEHMEVVGSDGDHVGRVDHVKGDQIELAKWDWGSGLKHHYVPTDWIDRIEEDKVYLSIGKDEAKRRWIEK